MLRNNHAGFPAILICVISGILLYWFGFGGTFWGALYWYNQLAVHLACSLVLAAGGWVLWKRTQPVRLQSLHPALNAALGLLLLEKAIRALGGQSWKAAEDFAEAVSLFFVFYLVLNVLQEGTGLAGGLIFAS